MRVVCVCGCVDVDPDIRVLDRSYNSRGFPLSLLPSPTFGLKCRFFFFLSILFGAGIYPRRTWTTSKELKVYAIKTRLGYTANAIECSTLLFFGGGSRGGGGGSHTLENSFVKGKREGNRAAAREKERERISDFNFCAMGAKHVFRPPFSNRALTLRPVPTPSPALAPSLTLSTLRGCCTYLLGTSTRSTGSCLP